MWQHQKDGGKGILLFHISFLDSSCSISSILWLVLVIGMTTCLIIQLNEKITGYLKTPVTIDIDVHYEPIMYYPAVVICNANSFK